MTRLDELTAAPTMFLEAMTPLKVDIYLFMPLNQNLVLFRKKGEALSLQEAVNLTRPSKTRVLVKKDQIESGTTELATALAHDVTPDGMPGEALEKFGSAQMSGMASAAARGQPEARALTTGLLDESTQLMSEVVAQFKSISGNHLFHLFVKGLCKSGDPLDVHNRHVSALSSILLLTLGGASMEELSEISLAGLVHDSCLDQIPQLFLNRHLDAEDLALSGTRQLSAGPLGLTYRAHVDLALKNLDIAPFPVSTGVRRTVDQHHENYDGTGLLGLRGVKIYRPARLLRIADDLITLINNDRNPMTIDGAIRYMLDMNQYADRRVYDPDMLGAIAKKVIESRASAG